MSATLKEMTMSRGKDGIVDLGEVEDQGDGQGAEDPERQE